MKNSAGLVGCYPPRPTASVDNTLLDLQNSSYPTQPHSVITNYYMASSANGQDDRNRAMWLATRADKMEPSYPLGTTRCIPHAKFNQSHIINPLLTKFVRSRWLDIDLVLFCEFMDLDFVSVHKHAKKELGQYPAILTSHLVNNPYLSWVVSQWFPSFPHFPNNI